MADTYSDIERKAEAAATGVIRGTVRTFLREYWLWIVIPFVLVVGGLALAWLMMSDEGATPFVYNIY